MRLLVTGLSTFLLCLSLHAQQSYPCADSGAVPIDTLGCVLDVDGGGASALRSSNSSGQIIWEEIVMNSPGGNPSIQIVTSSILVTGTAQALSTQDIFAAMGEQGVRRALDMGTIPCPPEGTSRIVQVRQAGCVMRMVAEPGTHFQSCSEECCTRYYSVSCPPGQAPVITLLSSDGPDCVIPGCEPTCGGKADLAQR